MRTNTHMKNHAGLYNSRMGEADRPVAWRRVALTASVKVSILNML
jgi:hypothetical protein